MPGTQPFEALFEQEFRWPTPGDRPFMQSARRLDNACVESNLHGRLVMMMAGYKLAADLMVERAVVDRHDRDALVYPVLFNYRQFIELSLKYVIATYGMEVGIAAIWKSHDLGLLWKTFSAVLEGYGVDDSEGADVVVAEIVAEFSKVDPASFSYRYPVDTSGRPISIAHDQLDLVNLADVMKAVEGYFSGCDGYLDNLRRA